MTVFASGVLVATLLGCRGSADTAAPSEESTPAQVQPETPEVVEAPLHVRAPEAPPVATGKGAVAAAPVPTSVMIRPGHAPIRMAGAMVMHHPDSNTF